jgi:hypothetical protein
MTGEAYSSATLADLIVDFGASGSPVPRALRWMAEWLPRAERRALAGDDLQRIDAVHMSVRDLFGFLPAVLPLARPVWFEAVTRVGGKVQSVVGYAAVPALDGIDVGLAWWSPSRQRLVGPFGPMRTTPGGTAEMPSVSAVAREELKVAAGVVVRALLLSRRGAEMQRQPELV